MGTLSSLSAQRKETPLIKSMQRCLQGSARSSKSGACPSRGRVITEWTIRGESTYGGCHMSHLIYPNESAEYREARNKLLAEEIALRRQMEAVAARRRALPPGGAVPQDYLFERIGKNLMPERVEMSKLFGRHPTLILYSF